MKRILFILSISLLTFFSCTDEGLVYLNDIEKAAFVHFIDAPGAIIGTNTIDELVYEGELVAQGPVASYALEVYGTLAGANTDTAVVETYTSFPVNFSFTAQELATLVGVDVTDINFGDSFGFIGTVTGTDGSVYYAEAPEVEEVDDGPDIYHPNGSTEINVFDPTNGYKDGFLFGFTIGCPPNTFDANAMAGTYNVLFHRFDAFFGPQGTTRTVVAGPGDNQLTIVGGAVPLDGADDLIIEVDQETNDISYAGPAGAIHFNTFGPGAYAGVTGTMYGCVGTTIDIAIQSDGFIDNFLVLEIQ